MTDQGSSLDGALRALEAAEANLAKLDRLWDAIRERIPSSIYFATDPKHEDLCRSYATVREHLPAIDGWRIESEPWSLNAIAQARLDCEELGEISCTVATEEEIASPGRELAEYRFRLNRKRRELVRSAVLDLVERVEEKLNELYAAMPTDDGALGLRVPEQPWSELRGMLAQVDTLLGGAVARPERWHDLRRHAYFGQYADLADIVRLDWPKVKPSIVESLYGDDDPVPVDVSDLGELSRAKPRGPIATELKWSTLDEESFERLIFALISNERGYENPQWLTRTTASDRGRDLSCFRAVSDPLCGTRRERVILQCRHWLSRSFGPPHLAQLLVQASLWDPPADVVIIATSGRFTDDAVVAIEKHNISDRRLRIEMWPESHLERLLAERPALIGAFCLR